MGLNTELKAKMCNSEGCLFFNVVRTTYDLYKSNYLDTKQKQAQKRCSNNMAYFIIVQKKFI